MVEEVVAETGEEVTGDAEVPVHITEEEEEDLGLQPTEEDLPPHTMGEEIIGAGAEACLQGEENIPPEDTELINDKNESLNI